MKFSRDWIGEYVALPAAVEETAVRLTAVGLTVEGIEPRGTDAILEVDVTTNRADAMSHLGLARELAVSLGERLRPPHPPHTALAESNERTAAAARVTVEDGEDCPRYVARAVRGVRVGESPRWLRERLESIGLRPINNVVDVTNFVLWEMGQPLHAFDLDRLAGRELRVRRARAGETLVTLDGVGRVLTPRILVIADAERPVALAGVMGGRDSEVTPATVNVLLESAHFGRARVRAAAKQLALHTDASHRFERGADPESCALAAARAAHLIAELAGGEVLAGAIDVRAESAGEPRRGRLILDRLQRFAGIEISAAEVERILAGLGFAPQGTAHGVWSVTVPSWRTYDFDAKPNDLGSAARDEVEEADLFEEVIRHVGYDRIPAALPEFSGSDPGQAPEHARRSRIREHLAACGFAEAIHFAFHSREADAAFPGVGGETGRGAPLQLANPLADNLNVMRRSLLPNLIESAHFNQRHGAPAVRLFEIGHLFPGGEDPEVEALGWICGGSLGSPWERRADLDLFDLKGPGESLAQACGAALRVRPASLPGFDPGTCGEWLDASGAAVGAFGQVAEAPGPFPLFAAEILTSALAGAGAPLRVRVPSRFPGVAADMTITHALSVSWIAIEETIRERAVPDLAAFGLKDRYRGEGVPEGTVKTTISFDYHAEDRSLTQEEVNERHLALQAELEKRFAANS